MNPQSASPPSFRTRYSRGSKRIVTNLTPLIDVVFILLLFFMLASNFNQDNSISLNAPAGGSQAASATGALLVNVRTNGIRVAGKHLSQQGLVQRIAKLNTDHSSLKVLVHPGTDVDLQQTVAVLDTLKSAGVSNLRLMGQSRAD